MSFQTFKRAAYVVPMILLLSACANMQGGNMSTGMPKSCCCHEMKCGEGKTCCKEHAAKDGQKGCCGHDCCGSGGGCCGDASTSKGRMCKTPKG